jgi:hypothetical protein
VLPVAAIAALLLAACGGDDESSDGEPFTSGGFERALDAVREEAGDDASLLRLQITDRGVEFQLLGDQPRGLIYTGGDLQETEIVLAGELSEAAFPLSEVDPEAVDTLIDSAEQEGGGEIDPLAITLERSTLDGELRWTLNASGGIAFSAGPDGSQPVPAADPQQQGP